MTSASHPRLPAAAVHKPASSYASSYAHHASLALAHRRSRPLRARSLPSLPSSGRSALGLLKAAAAAAAASTAGPLAHMNPLPKPLPARLPARRSFPLRRRFDPRSTRTGSKAASYRTAHSYTIAHTTAHTPRSAAVSVDARLRLSHEPVSPISPVSPAPSAPLSEPAAFTPAFPSPVSLADLAAFGLDSLGYGSLFPTLGSSPSPFAGSPCDSVGSAGSIGDHASDYASIYALSLDSPPYCPESVDTADDDALDMDIDNALADLGLDMDDDSFGGSLCGSFDDSDVMCFDGDDNDDADELDGDTDRLDGADVQDGAAASAASAAWNDTKDHEAKGVDADAVDATPRAGDADAPRGAGASTPASAAASAACTLSSLTPCVERIGAASASVCASTPAPAPACTPVPAISACICGSSCSWPDSDELFHASLDFAAAALASPPSPACFTEPSFEDLASRHRHRRTPALALSF